MWKLWGILIGVIFLIPSGTSAEYYDDVLKTKHSFGVQGREVCIICHTLAPEMPGSTTAAAVAGSTAKPLWDGATTASFSVEAPLQEFGTSLNCLSCHEDISSTHNPSMPGTTQETSIHPVGINYPVNTDGAKIVSSQLKKFDRYWSIPDKQVEGMILPSGQTSNYLQVPPDSDPNDPLVVTRLVRTTYGKMECDSCHDPHTNLFPPFLRADPRKLCLVCHNR